MRCLKEVIRFLLNRLPSSYIFMFHHVTDCPKIEKSKCKLSWGYFVSLMEEYCGKVAPLSEVMAKPSRKKIAVTFDDGLEDVYTIAYPFLKSKGIPFTIFVITDFLNQPGYLTTAQLLELASDELVTIGSHGVTHKIFPLLNSAEKEQELRESKNVLFHLIGKEINFFAYSHGQYDKETLKLVSRYYKYALSTISLPLNCLSKRRKLIPRVNFDNCSYIMNNQKIKEKRV